MTRRDIDEETILMLLVFAAIAVTLLASGIDWQAVDTETILVALKEVLR